MLDHITTMPTINSRSSWNKRKQRRKVLWNRRQISTYTEAKCKAVSFKLEVNTSLLEDPRVDLSEFLYEDTYIQFEGKTAQD